MSRTLARRPGLRSPATSAEWAALQRAGTWSVSWRDRWFHAGSNHFLANNRNVAVSHNLLRIVAFLTVIYSFYEGIDGIIKRKVVRNPAYLITAIGFIIFGVSWLIGIIVLIYFGKL